MENEIRIEVNSLKKQYAMAAERLEVLRCIDMTARSGEVVVIMGPSGSGKSTLISLLAGIDTDYEGSIRVEGVQLADLDQRQRVALRSGVIGLVFQEHRLLPQLTALENVEAPLYLKQVNGSARRSMARDALAVVSLRERERHRPDQLSGGERQRTAIARALVTGANVILCDEPTGSLNREMGRQIFQLLRDLCDRFGKTVILTTHDESALDYADHVLRIENGTLARQAIENEVRHALASC